MTSATGPYVRGESASEFHETGQVPNENKHFWTRNKVIGGIGSAVAAVSVAFFMAVPGKSETTSSQGSAKIEEPAAPPKSKATPPPTTKTTTTEAPTTTTAAPNIMNGYAMNDWGWTLAPNTSFDLKPYGDNLIQELWEENKLPTSVQYFSPADPKVYASFSDEQWGDLTVQNLQTIFQVASLGEGYYKTTAENPVSPRGSLPQLIHSDSESVLGFVDTLQKNDVSYLFLTKPSTTVGRYSSVNRGSVENPNYVAGDYVVVSLNNADISQSWEVEGNDMTVDPARISAYVVFDRETGSIEKFGIHTDSAPTDPIELPIQPAN